MKAYFDIDTQIDFMYPSGALYVCGAERLIPTVARLNHAAEAEGIPVISTMCAHPADAAEFSRFPPHCIVGTEGQRKPAETILSKTVTIPNEPSDVEVNGATQILLEKNDLDLFTNPNLTALLDQLHIDDCYVYGVVTEFCVKCAVMGLLKSGRKVSLVTNAIAHIDQAEGDAMIHDFLAAGGKCVSL